MKSIFSQLSIKHILLAACLFLSNVSWAQTASLESGIQALEKKEYANSLRIILPLAEKGDSEAQVFIGYMYENGLGVQRDNKEAFVWYEKAAAKGQVTAQFNLAYLYKNGLGVSKDDKQAAFWYEKAAKNGFSSAQNNLGYMYEKGVGVTKNFLQAAFWYQKAAEQGHKNAQINLAFLYENGLGVPKDIDRAMTFYERALLSPDQLSSADVTFARDRLDAIRSNLIKKDLLEPRKKVATADALASPKKEMYSEVTVAPDLSETRIYRQPATTPLDKVAAPVAMPKEKDPVAPSRIAQQPVVASNASAIAAIPKAKDLVVAPSQDPVQPVIAPPVAYVAPANSPSSQELPKEENKASSQEEVKPIISEKEGGKKSKKNVKSKEKKAAAKPVSSNEVPVVDKPAQVKPSLVEAPAVAPELTATASGATVANSIPSANAAPNQEPIIEKDKPLLNPDNLPIYGADGRPIKNPVQGSLALKGIQNDFQDLDGNFWLAKATVLIVDPVANYQPYSKGGVTVRGYFEPTGGDTSCVTDVEGKCTLVSAKIRSNVGSVKMKVYAVSR